MCLPHLDDELHGRPLVRQVGDQVEGEAQQGHHTHLEEGDKSPS